MGYDKEFEGWFGSWWMSGDFGSTRLAKDAAWYAWQAARKDHYRIGEEVENILTGERAEVKAVLSFTDSITHINPTNVRRIPAKSRIDEIAEEAASHWEGGKEALEKAIKSAILQARKEWEANQ